MKKIYSSIALILFFNLAFPVVRFIETYHPPVTDNFRIMVKFEDNIVSGRFISTKISEISVSNIRKILTTFDVIKIEAVFRNRYNDSGELKNQLKSNNYSKDLNNWYEIAIKNKSNADDLVELLAQETMVKDAYIEWPIIMKPAAVPDDDLYGNQWHLNSTTNPFADIDAEQAWDINKGRNDVIIAVCDGGVDYTHLDLDPGDRSRVIAGYDSGDDDNDPMDDLPDNDPISFAGHGTHVAGIIGAITDNDDLVSGVMWNCSIMPIKMVGTGTLEITYPFGSYNWDFSTTAFPSDVADAIDYAVNNGAHVINLSYGFADMGWPINDVILRVPLLFEAINNAYNQNVVIVVAMGNEGDDGNPTNYPAAFKHEVIAIGNIDESLARSIDSSFGSHINLSAPGTRILSTIRGGGSDVKSGTSMAAPVVSGVAGLIISQGMDRGF